MRKLLSLLGVGVCLLSLLGCSEPVGDVAGRVTYLGKPLTTGTLVMVGPNGKPVSSLIASDGTYRCFGVGAGKARITVSSPQPVVAGVPGAKEKPGKDGFDPDKPSESREAPKDAAVANAATQEQAKNWVAIPGKYADPNQTDLFFEVKAGQNTNNLELK